MHTESLRLLPCSEYLPDIKMRLRAANLVPSSTVHTCPAVPLSVRHGQPKSGIKSAEDTCIEKMRSSDVANSMDRLDHEKFYSIASHLQPRRTGTRETNNFTI